MTLAGPTTAILWTRPSPSSEGAGVSGGDAPVVRTASLQVYAGTRADVVPATLVRVPEGLLPAADGESTLAGTVELVIDETGAVEHVKIVAHGDYADIQRIARAWRRAEFKPAMRAGLPVRFRTSLPVYSKP